MFKAQPSADKLMASFLKRTRRDYIGFSGNCAHYANLLDQLKTVIRKNVKVNLTKGFCSNRTMQLSKIAMAAVELSRYELILHLAYSSNLAPRNYFLFQIRQTKVRGRNIRPNEVVLRAGSCPLYLSRDQNIEKEEIDLTQKKWLVGFY